MGKVFLPCHVFNVPALGIESLVSSQGELITYLRMLGIPIPSVYGPSADENPFD